MDVSPQVSPAAWRRQVQAGRGVRARGGYGAVCSHCLHKCEPHRCGQPGPRSCWGRRALAPGPQSLCRRTGVQRCACPSMGAMAAPIGRAISQRRAVSSGREVWGPLRSGSGLNPFSWMVIASALQLCLGSETRRRNAHPAPIGVPMLSPQSPSFALLRQHLGLAPSPLSGKAEPVRTVKTLPESSAG